MNIREILIGIKNWCLGKFYDKSETDALISNIQPAPSLFEAGSGENSVQQKGTGAEARSKSSVAVGQSIAQNKYAFAEGASNTANGESSHVEGDNNNTGGTAKSAHAEGSSTFARGVSSHTEGHGTVTYNLSEHAEGMFNVSHKESNEFGHAGNTQHSVGISTSEAYKKNAFEIMQNGDAYLYGVGDYEGNNLKTDETRPSKTVQDTIKSLENDSVWEEGSGENSAVLKESNGTAFGTNSIVEGISVTNAVERGITSASTDTEIITEWSASTPDTDKFSLAKGEASHVEGNNNLALGDHSHAEGNGTIAGNNSAHSEGTGSKAMGKYSHAEGLETEAIGTRSHTEGNATIAYNKEGHAEGTETIAGINPDTITPKTDEDEPDGEGGYFTTKYWKSYINYLKDDQCIYNDYVYTALKNSTNKKPSGSSSYWRREEAQHAEGKGTLASARASHAEGSGTQATNLASHAEGTSTVASNEASHAEGGSTTAAGKYSHAEGSTTIANDWTSHTEGYNTETGGNYVRNTKTPDTDHIVGEMAHAEGNSTIAKGNSSHSEGAMTFASGEGSHAEGYNEQQFVATKDNCIVDNIKSATTESTLYQTLNYSAEDVYTVGMKLISYAEIGSDGARINVEDQNITIVSVYENGSKWFKLSKKLGIGNLETIYDVIFQKQDEDEGKSKLCGAIGKGSHVEGINNVALNPGEHACGYNNVSNIDGEDTIYLPENSTIFSIGVGRDFIAKNAFEVMSNGEIYICGVGGYDGTNPTTQVNSLQKVLEGLGITIDWTKL